MPQAVSDIKYTYAPGRAWMEGKMIDNDYKDRLFKRNKRGMGIEEAVDKAIDDMPTDLKSESA